MHTFKKYNAGSICEEWAAAPNIENDTRGFSRHFCVRKQTDTVVTCESLIKDLSDRKKDDNLLAFATFLCEASLLRER